MSNKLLCPISFVLVLALVSCVGAQSDPLVHYEFEGDYSNSGTGTVAGQPRSGAAIIADPGGGLRGASNVLKLYGNDEYVKIGNDDVGSITTALTVSAWVKSDGTNWSNAGIVTRGYNWRLYISGSANGTIQCMNTAPGSKSRGSVNINEGEWHHVAGTYDGTQYILYIDGVQDGPAVPATGPIAQTTSHKFTIGAFESSGNVSKFYDGYIDDVRVYGEALDPMAIQGLAEGNGATITVEAGGDIAAANELAQPGDTIEIAEGTYILTSQIEIKDGVTYQGAGSGLTIIDGNNATRAFVGWGDRGATDGQIDANGDGVPNTTGPKDWVINGMTIQNCVADADGRENILSAARDLLNNYTGTPYTLATAGEENGGIEDNPDAFEALSGGADDDLTDVELQAYLDNNPPGSAGHFVVNGDKSVHGGGIFLANAAEGTLIDVAFDNCNALATELDTSDPNNPTTNYQGNGGAVRMSNATANILDCSFTNNNASVDGGAVSATNPSMENWDLTIENSTFTNNRARDDGGAIAVVRRNLSVINCVGDGNKTGLDPNTLDSDASGTPDGGFLWITGAGKVDGTSYTDDTPPLEITNYGGVVTVTGCTITNGESRRGGAIRSDSAAQLFVTDCVFTNCNTSTNDGGAIYANSPSPFNPAVVDINDPDVGEPGVYIEGVTVDGCIAGDDGGGIGVDNFSTTNSANYIEFPKVVINNTVVTNCRAGGLAPDDGGRDGGGIYVNNRLDVTITNTVVENCTAGRHGAGIMVDGVCNSVVMDGVRVSDCSNDDISGAKGDGVALCMDQDDNALVIVANCIFDNNINMQDDGVVRIDGDVIYVANCTFVGNTTTDKGILYFGTSHDDAAVVYNKAVNNLFVNNDSSPGSDNTINWAKDNNNNITLHNIFFGTILDGDSEIEDTDDADLGPNGNFIATADPLVDTAGGDYHLAAGSEAIDAGTAEDAPDHDFDGAVRPQGAAHDVGAYESPAN